MLEVNFVSVMWSYLKDRHRHIGRVGAASPASGQSTPSPTLYPTDYYRVNVVCLSVEEDLYIPCLQPILGMVQSHEVVVIDALSPGTARA